MNRWTSRAVGGVLFLLAFVAVSAVKAAADANQAATEPASLFFESSGRKIRMDRYAPARTQSKRTIIVLHGAGGTLFDGPSMRRVARALADDGDTVYLMHYFNRTGTIGALDSTMQTHFDEWLQTLRDGIQWVHGLEDKRVPVEKYAKTLRRVLSERGGHVETDWVPAEGHVLSETAMAAVRPKVAKFFARELR